MAMVSVPLRGVGCFLYYERLELSNKEFPSPCGGWVVSRMQRLQGKMAGFPSPCGVWVVSKAKWLQSPAKEFPSPCGVWVVSFFKSEWYYFLWFPSPCGVWVVSKQKRKDNQNDGFRPLAGCGLFLNIITQVGFPICFRPLAGCGLFRQSCTFFLVQQEKELSTLLFYCIILADVYQ